MREEVKSKSKETLYNKYGVYNPVELPWHSWNNGRFSRPHKKVSTYLNDIGVAHINDQPGLFRKFNERMNRTYSPIPDIYIPEKNLVIEIFGDRWHMNPRLYCETDVIRFFDGDHCAAEVWEGDHLRTEHIKSFGVDLLVIWEYDIKYNFASVQTMLQERIKK